MDENTITKERRAEYNYVALQLIRENGGRYRSRDFPRDIPKRIKLTPYEQSLNNTGRPRWETSFRFHSIGLVKAGLVTKEKGFWTITNKPDVDLDKFTVESLMSYCDDAYRRWAEEREGEIEDTDADTLTPEDAYEPPTSTLKINPQKVSFDELLRGVDKSTIQIPPFQREFVWSPGMIRYLLDSIYRGYPIGSFIFWRTSRRLPHHRIIGGIELSESSPGTLIDYVLDGQQRITSLYAAVRGAKIEGEKYAFFFNLKKGGFQYEKVKEDVATDEQQTRIPLERLFGESRVDYFKYIAQFPEEYQDLLNDLYDRFRTYAFSVIYVQEDEENNDEDQAESVKKIISIFSRINETGRKLSVVAKMVARCWGEGFDIREKFDEFYAKSDELEDVREETVLQAASVILNQRRCRTADILTGTDIPTLDREWDKIIDAFTASLHFLQNKIKIKTLAYVPFDTVLVSLTYFHYKNHNPTNAQSEQLKTWFWKACISNRYSSAVESKIEEDCEEFDKLLAGEKAEFSYPIDWETFKSRLIAQDYNLRNAFCKTVLSLYSYMDPKSFKDGREIDLKNAFSGYYKHHLHHFFPRAYLEKTFDPNRERRDSVVNIAFALAVVNNEMSDTAPSDYLREFEKDNPDIGSILKSHLIDDPKDFGIMANSFGGFLDKRSERIENEFRVLVGLKTKTEQQLDTEPSGPVDVLEIKMRELLREKLTAAYGGEYWLKAVPADVRMTAEKKIEDQVRRHSYEAEKYESADAKLSFLDMMDYAKIVFANWSLFAGIFKSKGELQKYFLDLKNYRNALKHNRDMNAVEKRNGEAAVLWFESMLSYHGK
ncbi:hypothetical protein A2704_04325 [Candidatus Kaiserbacteria bacterium RIFCSPHIGHO2_01_FULL_54_36b]|uniref:GmrSD restriction endonucleases N-terminal domain-containing protein n=1 Tax=Candidatus Kaiserbacteria bacterium RIFCSPHIGHO2_01_FULL_54_36b TaxID=1798483 RepID=A0A1F6CJE5_9BACT|nr:MAG: hypothetical protein A2704_04325 [Candidatus Kaiserbacteria bacterium RIFCSPHIGHO2_01_FULL_54_36b]